MSPDENISLGGMFIATGKPRSKGTYIVVDIGIGSPNEPAISPWQKYLIWETIYLTNRA